MIIDSDIISSVQVPQLVKDRFFQNAILVKDHRGRPIHYSGGFAIVFVFKVNGEKWAFRCWRNQPEKNIAHRLNVLSEEFKKLNLQYFCDFAFEPEGIFVNGITYPTTRMRWIEGQKLNEYIYQHKSDKNILKKLADDFRTMCNTLHEKRIAHGDLQHGNILIDENGKIFLIDYDSMFVPSLENEKDIIKGKKEYQHPSRDKNEYANSKLDYFSELIIYISILAISEEPTLADKYDIVNAERLLFQKEDFYNIKKSKVYKDIINLSQQLRDLVSILVWYLKLDDILDLGPFDFIERLKGLDISYGKKSICMNCGTFFVVNEDTKFCINCGNLLLDYELKKVKKCPKCGQKNPEVANVCRHCGYKFPEASKKGKTMQPIIKDLKAKENSYTIGSFINIMWDVANATHISLNGLNLTNHDSYEYEVKGDETLELVATNDYAQTTKSIKLSPIPLPKIVKFTPSRQKVKAGEKIEIRVHFKNSRRAFLLSNLSEKIDVSTKEVVEVTPMSGETYSLICYSIDPKVSVTKDLKLTVVDDVHIDAFSSNKNKTIEGEPVILSWKIKNAQMVKLYHDPYPDGIDVTGKTSIELRPSRTTTYKLEVTNGLNIKSEMLSISVIPIPKLNYKMPEFSFSFGKVSKPDLGMEEMLSNIHEIEMDHWMISPLEPKKESVFKRIKKALTSIMSSNG